MSGKKTFSFTSMKRSLRLLKLLLFALLFLCFNIYAKANDSTYARKIIDTLSSDYFKGRGYVGDGVQKAATYIAAAFQQLQLKQLTKNKPDYLLPFQHSINRFPFPMRLEINGKVLIPGKEFIVGEDSRELNAIGDLNKSDSNTYLNARERLVINLRDKLTWSASTTETDYTSFQVLKTSVSLPLQSFDVSVNNDFVKKFDDNNVAGFVKGTAKPDSFLVFTAHYDHLGMMGNTIFPGANDNASGVGLMLCLANYYAAHPQPYSILFIAFAGEEAGLLGSKSFTEHPPIDLKRIKFLTNLDLMGNGEEGITVVNATEFPQAFAALQQINTKQQLFPVINSRGKAANSDHYFFTEKGVPSFFIYTLGKRKDYHDINDIASTLPLYKINELVELLKAFYAGIH
jgi:aminopeptidase YwaD